jgi:23S rRNA-/tRNA-specific pseudouridylate synthase
MLHAWRLRLSHPLTGAEMTFEVAPPGDFESFWASLQ